MPPLSLSFLASLFFPKACLFCQREGALVCEDCQSTFNLPVSFFCLCLRPRALSHPGQCAACRRSPLAGIIAPLSYEEKRVQQMIQCFKYPPLARELAKDLTRFIITHLASLQEKMPVKNALVVPVPLTRKKLKRRGFNPAEALAQEVAEAYGLPLIDDCLGKTQETLPQQGLNVQQRKENIAGVFAIAQKEKMAGKRVVLVDDVFTTGATMEEAARVLRAAGAREVLGVAVARAGLNS